MKKTILFIVVCLFASNTLQAQSFDDLKNGNTFFILFEENKLADKKRIQSTDEVIKYQFYKDVKSGKKEYDFWFYYANYFNNKEAANGTAQTKFFRVHKGFIKKNKNIILTKNEMDSIGENNMIKLFKNTKRNLFLIDLSDIKSNQVLIREVKLHSMGYE